MGARSPLPVFVVGMPRSGTTLIEQILASHPSVHGAGELRTLHLLSHRIEGFPASVSDLSGAQLKALGEAYLAHVTQMAEGRPHVVDKMPSNFLLCGLIRIVLPDAKIIHSRRDPIDVCLSCYTKLFAGEQAFAYDQTELGRFHLAYQGLMAHWRAVLPASHFLEVDYEAVVDDLEVQARRIFAFLGQPWDKRVLNFHETERPIRTASVNQVREPIYPRLGRAVEATRGATQAASGRARRSRALRSARQTDGRMRACGAWRPYTDRAEWQDSDPPADLQGVGCEVRTREEPTNRRGGEGLPSLFLFSRCT